MEKFSCENMKSVLFLILIGTVFWGYAQFPINQLSVNEGLSHSDVNIFTQDHSGFIWMGTNNGLNRFDGYDFHVYKNDFNDSNSLPNNRITSILTDSQNRIWIATESNYIAYYNPKSNNFVVIPINQKGSLGYATHIIQDAAGKIWFTTNRNELFTLEEENGKFKPSAVLHAFESDIVSIEYYQSFIWISATDEGLWRIKDSSKKVERFGDRIFRNTYSLNTYEDELWVSAPEGIFVVNKKLEIKQLFNQFLEEVSALVVDYKNNIWLGHRNGGLLLLEKTLSGTYREKARYTATNSLSTNVVNDLIIDSFDILWIGTSGGGTHYIDLRAKPFKLINKENSNIPDNYVTAIAAQDGNLWIGTRNGLLLHDEQNGLSHIVTNDHISSLFLDENGLLWVGKRFNGVSLYKNEKLIRSFTTATNPDFPSNEVIGINKDNLGRLWVVTFNDGIVIIDKNNSVLTSFNQSNFLPTNHLNSIYFDKEKLNLGWIGSKDHGLFKITYDDTTVNVLKNYRFNTTDGNSLSSDYVWPILKSSSGDLWVGTIGGGLNRMIEEGNQTCFKRFTTKDGLPDNDVETLLEDGIGNLWIGGRGLTRFAPDKEQFINYDFNDGLQSNSFKVGSAFKNDYGILYFGGISGLNYFNPRLITTNPYKPKVCFDGLKILNKTVHIGDKVNDRIILEKALTYTTQLALKHSENEFTIELLGIHYSNPKKNRYAYKLDGYMDDWAYVNADERKITFANLPAGDYTLRAKVANRDGLWSDIKSLPIKISPAWWATWWSKVIYVLLFLSALYLYKLFVNRQSALKNNLVMAEKEMNLTSEKIKFFTNISHEIRTPLTLINSQVEDILDAKFSSERQEGKFVIIRNNVNRLLNLTNLLLDFRKMESGNLKLKAAEGNFSIYAKEIFSFFLSLAEKKNIDYTYKSEPENIHLTFDRDNFEIIITNLISNAFKYTKDHSAIGVHLKAVGNENEAGIFENKGSKKKLLDNYLEITIEDNGMGMSHEDLDKIFDRYYQVRNHNSLSIQGTGIGLSLVKGLVELHGGEIEVESSENIGSKFIVKIPFGQQHLKPQFLIKEFKKSDHTSFYSENSPVVDEVPIEKDQSALLKRRILIVEDNIEIQNYLFEHFKNSFKVLQALNGEKGLLKARKYTPDIIISDVMMPKMDGLEMLKNLKNDPDLSYIPVILLTARTANLYEFEGIDTGAQDYITKPFSIKILKGKVNNILLAREKYQQYYKSRVLNESSSVVLPNSEQKFFDKITNIVLENLLNEDFSVKMLVEKMGMSQSSCYKRIKELTGRSAVQFIRDVRLKKAGELLKENSYNVSEVAFMVGINDIQYFRKKFKEHYGCNPSQFSKT